MSLKVTDAEIIAAVRKVMATGQQPSVSKVTAITGGGGKDRINKFIREGCGARKALTNSTAEQPELPAFEAGRVELAIAKEETSEDEGEWMEMQTAGIELRPARTVVENVVPSELVNNDRLYVLALEARVEALSTALSEERTLRQQEVEAHRRLQAKIDDLLIELARKSGGPVLSS